MTNNTVATALTAVLTNSYALYYKTQNYHWNVDGPAFVSLHQLFETQYEALKNQIDQAAELIRGLDQKVTVSLSDIQADNDLGPVQPNANAADMIADLIDGHTAVERALTVTLDAAGKAGDEVVSGFVADSLTQHRQDKWMLRSLVAAA